MFLSQKTFNWIADHFGLHLFDFAPSYKYANLDYLSYQLEHFDYKIVEMFSGSIRWVVPNRVSEALIPISLGESRCILLKPTF